MLEALEICKACTRRPHGAALRPFCGRGGEKTLFTFSQKTGVHAPTTWAALRPFCGGGGEKTLFTFSLKTGVHAPPTWGGASPL